MSHIDTAWSRLASRTARGLLARKGATYEDVVRALQGLGVAQTRKAVELTIQRGTFKSRFFFQLLYGLGADLPSALQRILDRSSSWDDACRQVAQELLDKDSVQIKKLSRQLDECGGAHLSPAQLSSQLETGDYAFTVLLQLAYLYRFAPLDRFVDRSDLERAARESTTPS